MNTRYCIATPTADLFDSINSLAAAASGVPTNSKSLTRRERRLVAPKGAGVRSSGACHDRQVPAIEAFVVQGGS